MVSHKVKLTLLLIITLMPTSVLSCTWYGDKASYQRFGIDIGFVGKLVKKELETDEFGNRVRQWGQFQPLKLTHGKWKLTKKFYFGKNLGFPILEVGRIYVIHANSKGEYIVPCIDFYGFESFSSTKDEKYINYIRFLEEPTTANYEKLY